MKQGRTLKILIVEDDRLAQSTIAYALRAEGGSMGMTVEVFPASTITEAEGILERHPDLQGVLLDASLGPVREREPDSAHARPDLTVLLFLKHLRGRYPDLLVVAMSGDPSCNDRLVREGCTVGSPKENAHREFMRRIAPPVSVRK